MLRGHLECSKLVLKCSRIYKFCLNTLPSKTVVIPCTCGLSQAFLKELSRSRLGSFVDPPRCGHVGGGVAGLESMMVFDLAMLNLSDRRRSHTYVLLLLRIKRWGLFLHE